jgi:hypothetical protein
MDFAAFVKASAGSALGSPWELNSMSQLPDRVSAEPRGGAATRRAIWIKYRECTAKPIDAFVGMIPSRAPYDHLNL